MIAKTMIRNLGFFSLIILAIAGFAQVEKSPTSSPPKLPMNIPPPPSFASMGSKSGKFQIISAEYYSQDEKPYLFTNVWSSMTRPLEAWVLNSVLSPQGEKKKVGSSTY